MDGLRWFLLLLGLLIIAGVYLYSRREKKPTEDGVAPPRVAPSLDGSDIVDDAIPAIEDVVASGPLDDSELAEQATYSEPIANGPQKIVTVRVVARSQKSFAGDELVLSMRGIGLRHGKFGIFHRYDGGDSGASIFSAASLVEPGSFDLENIKEQQIPGISLFLVLPGPVECVEAFDLMLAAGRALAQSLDGELLDETGSTLSIQRERYLREEIIQFQHSSLVS